MLTRLFWKCETKARQKIVNKQGTWALESSFFVYKNQFGDVAWDLLFYPSMCPLSRDYSMTKHLQCFEAVHYAILVKSESCSLTSSFLLLPAHRVTIFSHQTRFYLTLNTSLQPAMTQIKQFFHFALIQHLFWFLVFVEHTARQRSGQTVLLGLAVRLSIKIAF